MYAKGKYGIFPGKGDFELLQCIPAGLPEDGLSVRDYVEKLHRTTTPDWLEGRLECVTCIHVVVKVCRWGIYHREDEEGVRIKLC